MPYRRFAPVFTWFCANLLVHAAMGASGTVNLPYGVNDNSGNMWMIFQAGMFNQQGNMPLYSQGAMLMVNGAPLQQNQNQARVENESGEVVFENLMAQNVTITRRVQVDRQAGFVRYIDIFRNGGGQ